MAASAGRAASRPVRAEQEVPGGGFRRAGGPSGDGGGVAAPAARSRWSTARLPAIRPALVYTPASDRADSAVWLSVTRAPAATAVGATGVGLAPDGRLGRRRGRDRAHDRERRQSHQRLGDRGQRGEAGGDGGEAFGGLGGGASGDARPAGTGGQGTGGNGGDGGYGGGVVLDGVIRNSTISGNRTGTGGAGEAGHGGKGGSTPGGDGDGGFALGGDAGDGGQAAVELLGASSSPLELVHDTIVAKPSGAQEARFGGRRGAGQRLDGQHRRRSGWQGRLGRKRRRSARHRHNREHIVSAKCGFGGWAGPLSDGGHNISFPGLACPGANVDPNLGPLADNPGPTRRHALLAGSPAGGRKSPRAEAACLARDQRGVARPQGDACDIGAYAECSANRSDRRRERADHDRGNHPRDRHGEPPDDELSLQVRPHDGLRQSDAGRKPARRRGRRVRQRRPVRAEPLGATITTDSGQ